jgi:hypothetical protein
MHTRSRYSYPHFSENLFRSLVCLLWGLGFYRHRSSSEAEASEMTASKSKSADAGGGVTEGLHREHIMYICKESAQKWANHLAATDAFRT